MNFSGIFLGIYPEEGISGNGFNGLDALLITLIAIVIVFLVLIIVIAATHFINKGIEKTESSIFIKPRPENKLLEKDKDAVVAALVATIEFNKETGKDARLVKIEKIDE